MAPKKITFTIRPNPALHRRIIVEEMPTGRSEEVIKRRVNTDTTKVRVHLVPNSDPGEDKIFQPKRHELQQFCLRKGVPADTDGNLGHPLDLLPGTTEAAGWDVWPLTERYRCYDITTADTARQPINLADVISYSRENLFKDRLFLFNVLAALEWIPSRQTLQQLIASFQSASDFLYDATDGYMAFGQVVFGGMELMPGADIQILASNRFHPRSWVNGLNDAAKFTPIRIGRGIWQKNNSVSIPWNEPEGYRAIIHEWGHYALNLLDEYLEEPSRRQDRRPVQAKLNLVIPKLSIASESIMATLEGTSEIVPQQRRHDPDALKKIEDSLSSYPKVSFTGPVNEGPYKLPIERPGFYTTTDGLFGNDANGEEQLINVDDIELDHCWVYVLRWVEGDLKRIIAQGSLDARSRRDPETKFPEYGGDGFRLYGFQSGDTLLFIGNDRSPTKQLRVERRYLGDPVANGGKRKTTLDRNPATPVSIPVVTLIPKSPAEEVALGATSSNTARFTELSVRIFGEHQPAEVWVCPLGQENALPKLVPSTPKVWTSGSFPVLHLDGQVLLCWNRGTPNEQYMVYDYSQGGGPNSHVLAPDPPITAGSSDGNVMFFFRSGVPKSDEKARPEYDKLYPNDERSNTQIHHDYSKIRIVTTCNYAGFDDKNPGEPRSYLFSAAATRSIPAEELSPTLVMNFDRDALEGDGVLQIKQYDETPGDWIGPQTHIPKGAFFAAIAIEKKNGLEPFDTRLPQDGIAHYRMFLIPPSPTGGAD